MDTGLSHRRTRRSMLAATGAGVAALAAQALGRPMPASATHGDVHLGGTNQTDNVTTIHNTWSSGDAISGVAPDVGVRGQGATGVLGTSSNAGIGVSGRSNAAATSAAVNAEPLGATQTGIGVYGESKYGTGIKAVAEQRAGLHAIGGLWGVVAEGSQNGVYASSPGVAVAAVASGPGGVAFGASGRVDFSTSGLATVAVGTKSKTVPVGVDVTAGARVLCTLESNQAALFIQRVTKNLSADSFTVFLNVAVKSGKTVKVAWFVIG